MMCHTDGKIVILVLWIVVETRMIVGTGFKYPVIVSIHFISWLDVSVVLVVRVLWIEQLQHPMEGVANMVIAITGSIWCAHLQS